MERWSNAGREFTEVLFPQEMAIRSAPGQVIVAVVYPAFRGAGDVEFARTPRITMPCAIVITIPSRPARRPGGHPP
jgi:hypothetical protein